MSAWLAYLIHAACTVFAVVAVRRRQRAGGGHRLSTLEIAAAAVAILLSVVLFGTALHRYWSHEFVVVHGTARKPSAPPTHRAQGAFLRTC